MIGTSFVIHSYSGFVKYKVRRQRHTKCPKIYRKYVLHLLKYSANLYSTDLRLILGHSISAREMKKGYLNASRHLFTSSILIFSTPCAKSVCRQIMYYYIHGYIFNLAWLPNKKVFLYSAHIHDKIYNLVFRARQGL